MSCLHALPSFLVHLCGLLCVSLKKGTPFGSMVIHSGPLSNWGYGPAPFQLEIWIGPLCTSSYAPCATEEGEGREGLAKVRRMSHLPLLKGVLRVPTLEKLTHWGWEIG